MVSNSQCRAFFLLGVSVADTASMRTGGWPAAVLRRRQPHFGGADVDVHYAPFAGALATARGQFQRLRRQSRLPREVIPQVCFPAVLEDHLPLRRTAGAHQQPGAVGCRLA